MEIIIMLVVLVSLIALGMATDRWGVDSRECLPDTHIR